jgi:selenium metabolism protein YedF
VAERQIDARGLECPQPVMLARTAILEPDVDAVHIAVDDDASAENIPRMAKSHGWTATVQRSGREFQIFLNRTESARTLAETPPAAQPAAPQAIQAVVFVDSNLLGTGDEELGRTLMRMFLKTLRDVSPRPSDMIFINSGVRLTAAGSESIDDLRELERMGVRIYSCTTCLNYYHLKESLQVGMMSNMFEIASTLLAADRVVRP